MLIDRDTTSRVLTSAVANLSLIKDLDGLSKVVTEAARDLTNSSGTTFVVREGQQCFYADENAISPVLKGKRFPLEACVSGWSILKGESVVVTDLENSFQMAHEVYQPGIKSLCIVPIRPQSAVGAIGVYWATTYRPNEKEVYALQVLANAAAVAIENLMLKRAIVQQQTTLPKSFTMWPFQVDVATQRISLFKESGSPELLNLTPTESKLLINFMQHEGTVFSRDQLVKIIWGSSTHVTVNTIDTHLSSLRKKIGEAAKLIQNIRGKGFCFQRPPEQIGLLPETRLSYPVVA